MCLSEIKPLIEALQALDDARLELVQWTETEPAPAIPTRAIQVTTAEGVWLLQKRIAAFEETCRELGYNGPVRKVEPGDAVRLMESRLTTSIAK